MHQFNLSHPKYRPDIDGLRAIAVLSVVSFHAFPNFFKSGFIGVDIFFVISGFLISTIIFENLEKHTFSFYEFYVRRIKRIFPALILVLISSFSLGWFFLLADEYKQLGKHIASGAGFISNFVLLDEVGYFDNSADTKPLLHLWSLGIEEQFYIFWPFLVWIAWRQKINFLVLTITVASISFILNIVGINSDLIATFYSPQTRFWELLIGSLLAWFSLQVGRNNKYKIGDFWLVNSYNDKVDSENRLANGLSLAGFFLLVSGFWGINKDLNFPGYWALFPVLGSALIISAGANAWLNRKILSNKIAVWFGLISFPLYLWHWPILSFVRIVEGDLTSYKMRICALTFSVALAWLTFRFVENPFRIGKSDKAKAIFLITIMSIVGYIGYNTYIRDGLMFRHANKHNINRLKWFRGKDDWLFIGNPYDRSIAKLKLTTKPSLSEIKNTKEIFSKIALTASKSNTKVVLIVGPNKSSIYPEFLPDEIVPSTKKYSSFFLDNLRDIPNLTIYDPTDDLLLLKNSEGILYWMTDTHWNNKGAFLAYSGFSRLINSPVPQVTFKLGTTYNGDILGISRLNDFPLHNEDNWDTVWEKKPVWSETQIQGSKNSPFGQSSIVDNKNSLSEKKIWVIGDSFGLGLRQYFNATFKQVRYSSFKQVRYKGDWEDKINELNSDLSKVDPPDMIIIIRVERSF